MRRKTEGREDKSRRVREREKEREGLLSTREEFLNARLCEPEN